MRYLQGGSISPEVYAVPIEKGGTGALTSEGAAQNLRLVTESMRDVPGGVVSLDISGKINPDRLPSGVVFNGSNNVSGLTELAINQSSDYTITDYDVFTTYTLTADVGSVSRVDEIITYVAPSVVGNYGFTLNGKDFVIVVGSPIPIAPTITSPIDAATQIGKNVAVTLNSFGMLSGFDSHYSTDWEIATDIGFTTIVVSSINDTVNKTTWTSGDLDVSTTYYLRARFKGSSYGYGAYSNTISFTTKAMFTPSVEQAILTASDKVVSDNFGHSVSIDDIGTRVVIGAVAANVDGFTDTGAVYVFLRSGSIWTQEAKLTASDRSSNEQFGKSVSIDSSGDRIVVGANTASSVGNTNNGQVYIFLRTGTTWTEEAILKASDKIDGDYFGRSVDIDSTGTRVVIGANVASSGGTTNAGKAYIFLRTGTTWTQEAILTASDKTVNDYFGVSVAMDNNGDRVVIGAYAANPDNQSDAGKAYIFLRTGTSWTEESILIASDRAANDQFGSSVDIDSTGTRVIVGSVLSSPSGITNAGKAYIFLRTGTTWAEEAILTASGKTAGYLFGYSVTISDDGINVAVGEYGSSINGATAAGAVYIFTRSGTVWTEEDILTASDRMEYDRFGNSISMSGDGTKCVIGAEVADPSGLTAAGKAYIFA